MSFEPTAIENLVFEGGGTKGAAYAGCMAVMDEWGLLSSVRRVAGTSAGSIIATLLACGAGSKGLTESVYHTDLMTSFLIENANARSMHPDDKSRTVFIDDLGVSGTDFNTSEEMIRKLVESGRKATEAYFAKRGQVLEKTM